MTISTGFAPRLQQVCLNENDHLGNLEGHELLHKVGAHVRPAAILATPLLRVGALLRQSVTVPREACGVAGRIQGAKRLAVQPPKQLPREALGDGRLHQSTANSQQELLHRVPASAEYSRYIAVGEVVESEALILGGPLRLCWWGLVVPWWMEQLQCSGSMVNETKKHQ